jgi:glyoxylase-like metal-dependent hydrolase (beta-lactamase superfamily II)
VSDGGGLQAAGLHLVDTAPGDRIVAAMPASTAFLMVGSESIKGVYADRVAFCLGEACPAPGIECHLVGGHTNGLQVVRVHTRRGWVVLASDASHYYENMDAEMPYPIVFHVGDMVAGWDKVRSLADSPKHVVPGHDPDVLRRYPQTEGLPPELSGEMVSLHEVPSR